jgi:hypothetical protein
MHNIENEKNTLENLLIKIKETNSRKQDFIAPTKELQFRTIVSETPNSNDSEIIMEGHHGEPTRFLKVNDLCFDQIAQKNGLDVRTARRLQSDYPMEYDSLTNAIWLRENSKRMIRSYDDVYYNGFGANPSGTARAFLSDKFKTFDNSDLLESALPQLMESDASWKIVNCDVTEKKMYIRLKSEVITGTGANLHDLTAHGVGISNSETGAGSINVHAIIWTLACLNGMQTQNITRRSHITSARDGDTWNILTEETKQADNHSLKLQLRDIVSSYASRDTFDENLEKMKLASEDTINVETTEAVENLGKVLTLSKKETSSVLDGLLKTIGQAGYENDKPVNRATMINAVTRVANTAKADDVDFWQKLGGSVLNMRKTDWNRVAMAS